MALRERLKFLPNDDRSIDNGFALQLCLGMSCIQEHVTAAERKSNVQFTRQSVELVQTTVCYLEPIMEPNKKTSSKCGDVLHKGSSFLSLCFVVVDRGVVFENGIDKQENRDERTANFQSREPRRDRITADNRAQKRYGNSRK